MSATPALLRGVLFVGIPWEPETAQSRAATSAALTAEHEARQAAIRTASPDGMTAMERAIAQITKAGNRTRIETVKRRARQFIRRPVELNALSWNLSQAEPDEGLREVRRCAAQDGATHNICAAAVAFRWARRAERNGTMDALIYGVAPLQAAE